MKDIPKILETPYIGKDNNDKNRLYPPYLEEIKMIREKKYNSNFLDEIRKYYS